MFLVTALNHTQSLPHYTLNIVLRAGRVKLTCMLHWFVYWPCAADYFRVMICFLQGKQCFEMNQCSKIMQLQPHKVVRKLYFSNRTLYAHSSSVLRAAKQPHPGSSVLARTLAASWCMSRGKWCEGAVYVALNSHLFPETSGISVLILVICVTSQNTDSYGLTLNHLPPTYHNHAT